METEPGENLPFFSGRSKDVYVEYFLNSYSLYPNLYSPQHTVLALTRTLSTMNSHYCLVNLIIDELGAGWPSHEVQKAENSSKKFGKKRKEK
jgi:hypothetical protein